MQARLESKINLHPALAKSKIPDLGYKFKWKSQVNPMKFDDFLESIQKLKKCILGFASGDANLFSTPDASAHLDISFPCTL